MQSVISNHIEQIKTLCDSHEVKSLFAFGSVVGDNFNDTSDVDLVVDIQNADPLKYADNYFALKFTLENLLGRKIDLLESNAIVNPYLKKEIQQTGVLIYGN
jgi:predicted nucleotidyltransferase